MNLGFVLFFISSLYASVHTNDDIDQKLSEYVKEFQLVNVSAPKLRNQKLWLLGRNLFHESALSGNNNISCLDCHHPRVMTHDNLPLGLGEGASGIEAGHFKRLQGTGKVLARNTQALFNLHNVHVMFWDGRVEFNPESGLLTTPVALRTDIANTLKSALAAQAIFPLVDHDEMRGQKGSNPIANAKDEHEAWDLIVEKILNIKDYKKLFEEVFPDEKINIGHFGEALAEFQSHNFFFSDTPYDRYIKGDRSALTLNQKKGMEIFFNKGKCGDCHQGEHLSLFDFDNVAAPQIGPGKDKGDDFGRYQWDNDENSRYGFRVTPLRNVALTAPYFHSGSLNTIEDVVEHYNDIEKSLKSYKLAGQLENYVTPLKDHSHQSNELRLSLLPEDLPLKLNLTPEEKSNLVDFLKYGLTDLRLHGNIKQ